MNIFLSEFLWCAVLWGKLATALLWWLRSKAFVFCFIFEPGLDSTNSQRARGT